MSGKTMRPTLLPRSILSVVGVLVLIAMSAAVPFVVDSYFASMVRDALIFSILAIGLDFLWGKAGILSFGHAAFFGAGAYGVAVISTRMALDPTIAAWVGLLIGMAIAAFVSALVGYFLIYGKVRGPYLTIVTLALAAITDHIAVGWSQITGGNAGLLGVLPLYFPTTTGMGPLGPLAQYWFVLGIVVAVAGFIWWLCNGRYGALLAAIQDNEPRAQALGHDTSLHLLAVFVASAIVAALGGGLYAATVGFVAPDIAGLTLSTQVIVWVAIGGRGTLIGPIIATIVVIWLEQKVSSIDTKLWPLAIGGLFILSVFVFPHGIVAKIRNLFVARRRGVAQAEEQLS